MTPSEYHRRVHRHVEGFFTDHRVALCAFDRGPIQRVLPGFHALQVDPGPLLGQTTYVSVGAGFPDDGLEHLEFVAVAPAPSPRHVELLAMTSHYHRTGERLGLGHLPHWRTLGPRFRPRPLLGLAPLPFRTRARVPSDSRAQSPPPLVIANHSLRARPQTTTWTRGPRAAF